MPIAFIAVITALLYLSAAGIQLVRVVQGEKTLSRSVVGIAIGALACHLLVAVDNITTAEGLTFGFYKLLALLFLAVNVSCVIALTRRPLQNLLVGLFPLSAVAVLLSTLGPDTSHAYSHLGFGILLHIGASIVAYSILTLAAAQAALVAVQDRQLKRRRMQGLYRVLPPLQLMETMLFELLWVGVAALTLSIGSGMLFMEDMFAQHLVHKTVLSIIAWLLFSLLLAGHHWLGWRSQTAVKLTLAGFVLLLLAFFGSKLVLEIILQRS